MLRRLLLLLVSLLVTCAHTASAVIFLVTTNADSGPGSLRQAILDANATPGADAIHFSIGFGPQTINAAAPLPGIAGAVVVDGTTQPGFTNAPLIAIDVHASDADGLSVAGEDTTIRGLAISAPGGAAIRIQYGSRNFVAGNYLGVDLSGARRKANRFGIAIAFAHENQIGSNNAADRNIIFANRYGIYVEGFAVSNVVEGNFIGTDVTGKSALLLEPFPAGSPLVGIAVGRYCDYTTIGGASPGAGNVVGDFFYGIVVQMNHGAVIQGNRIGYDVDGVLAIPNLRGGVGVDRCSHVTVGGTETSARNIVGNGAYGIGVGQSSNVVIQGNWAVSDVKGKKPFEIGVGVQIYDSLETTIGGPEPFAGNLISANSPGVRIVRSTNTVIQGNLIGTDITDSTSLGNQEGIFLESVRDTLIGGTEAGSGNVISGNLGHGLRITNSHNNIIQGNLIGIDQTGQFGVPNHGAGVLLSSAARNNVIGGTGLGEGNVIAFNTGDGVLVQSDASANPILANSIHSNGRLGINLQPVGEDNGVVTPNDISDNDSGPNNLQNFPVITNVVYLSNNTIIQGYLRSSTNGSFSIDVYANVATEQSGYGEGQFYLGNVDVDTDESGFTQFAFSAGNAFSNQFFTATALNYDTADTSEFSAAMGGIRITSIERLASQYRVSFSTIANRTYVLQRASHLNSSMSWSPVVLPPQPIQGTGGIVTVSDPESTTGTMRVYRVFQQP